MCATFFTVHSDLRISNLLSPPDVSLHVLRCKLKCEDYLMPNIGGHFVQNFVANIYHHLQYSYYKCNFSASDGTSNDHVISRPD